MIEAGCIDPEDEPDDHEDVPDDHGNDIDNATVAAVGADVEGALDYDDDIDFFRFQAEQGQSLPDRRGAGNAGRLDSRTVRRQTGGFWTPTTTTGIPWPRASIGTLPVPASATF